MVMRITVPDVAVMRELVRKRASFDSENALVKFERVGWAGNSLVGIAVKSENEKKDALMA